MNARDLHDRGNPNFTQGNFPDAIVDYTQAITLSPQDADKAAAYFNRGLIHKAQGDILASTADFTLSFEHYKRVVEKLINNINDRDFQKNLANSLKTLAKAGVKIGKCPEKSLILQ